MPENSLTERRMRTVELLVMQGLPKDEAAAIIADEFDVAEKGALRDIRRLETWIGDLPPRTLPTGELRIQELRQARLRLYEIAEVAREERDISYEQRVLTEIMDSIEADIRLCQSLGLAVDAAGETTLPEDVDASGPVGDLAERDPAVVPGSR